MADIDLFQGLPRGEIVLWEGLIPIVAPFPEYPQARYCRMYPGWWWTVRYDLVPRPQVLDRLTRPPISGYAAGPAEARTHITMALAVGLGDPGVAEHHLLKESDEDV